MPKKQDGNMEKLQEREAKIIQLERDTDLTALLFITRELGKLEGILSNQDVTDSRLERVKDDLSQTYDRLIDKVGLSENMRLQKLELEQDDYEGDH